MPGAGAKRSRASRIRTSHRSGPRRRGKLIRFLVGEAPILAAVPNHDHAGDLLSVRSIRQPRHTVGGAEMVADAFEEMLKDNRREKGATRACAYAGKVRFDDITFEKLADYEDWCVKAATAHSPGLSRRTSFCCG